MNSHPQADFERFKQLVRDRLGAVLSLYEFKETDAHLLYPGMWVIYRNATTHVQVYFEYEVDVTVAIHPLVASGADLTVGKGHLLDRLVMARTSQRIIPVQLHGFDEKAIGDELENYAAALKQYADDVLRGDFAVFSQFAQGEPH